MIKAHYIKKLAEVLGVSEDAVNQEVEKKYIPARQDSEGQAQKQEEPQTRQERLEEYLLALVLVLGDKMAPAVKRIDIKSLSQGASARVFNQLQQWFTKQTVWEINRFVTTLPEELVGAVDTAYLTDLKQTASDPDALAAEIDKTLSELKKMAAKIKLSQLTREIKAAVGQKDTAKRKALETELVETTRLLGYNHD